MDLATTICITAFQFESQQRKHASTNGNSKL